MKYSTCILFALVFGSALFEPTAHSADEKSKPAQATTGAVFGPAWQRRLPEIDLGDRLPLADVAKNLTERFPEVNFVVPETARDEPVPRLNLRNVTLSEILKAIEIASEGRIHALPPNAGMP